MKYPRYFIFVGDTGRILFTKILKPGDRQLDVYLNGEEYLDSWEEKDMLDWVEQGRWKEILVEEVALKFGRV